MNQPPIRILFLLALATSLLCRAAGAQDIDLLLLAGQSNSVGRATPVINNGVAIPGTNPLDSRVRYYFDVDNTGGSFPADSGQTFGPLTTYFNTASNRDELGHEFGASRRLVETRNNDLAVIKFSVGAAGISRWQPGAVDYGGFLDAVTDGVEELIDDGLNVNIVGLAWHQGESDGNASGAPLYAGRLDAFISGIRNDLNLRFPTLGFESLRVALVEPAQTRGAAAQAIANLNIVDAAMVNFAASDGNAAFVQTSDIDGYIDVIHFNAPSQQLIGERIATALTGIARPSETDSTFIQPDSVTADTVFNGFPPSNLTGQRSSASEAIPIPAASEGNAYASNFQPTAELTLEFATPQNITDFVFWNYRNREGNGSGNNGTASFTLRLYDGVAGSGNLISTTSSVTELAPQNGSIPAQIFSVGGVAERVRSGILTLTDNDGSGFVGAHEVGFISPPQSGSPGASACVATSNLARNQDATQSSEFGNNAFPAANALDGNFANFTHTAPSQSGASWEVELQSNSIIDNVVLHNRGGCCKSRLRDITVSVINSSGTTVFQSPLLNPENTANSPNQIAVDVTSLSGEAVVGNTIRIDRTSDPDLSGVNSTGGISESDVLSLAEVEVFGCVN